VPIRDVALPEPGAGWRVVLETPGAGLFER